MALTFFFSPLIFLRSGLVWARRTVFEALQHTEVGWLQPGDLGSPVPQNRALLRPSPNSIRIDRGLACSGARPGAAPDARVKPGWAEGMASSHLTSPRVRGSTRSDCSCR